MSDQEKKENDMSSALSKMVEKLKAAGSKEVPPEKRKAYAILNPPPRLVERFRKLREQESKK